MRKITILLLALLIILSLAACNVDGKNGDKGLSAYEIYKKYHQEYTGTEQEWIEDLANGRLARYTVTFNSLDETSVTSITNLTKGSKISEPATLLKTGNLFGGWFKEQSCKNQWNFDEDTVAADITLYAKWIEIEGTNGLTFEKNGNEYTLTGIGTAKDSNIIVPSYYKNLPVTAIAYGAFLNCKNIVSVKIPDTVTSIGASIFGGCAGLQSITVPFVGSSRDTTYNGGSIFAYFFGGGELQGLIERQFSYITEEPLVGRWGMIYYPAGLKTVVITDATQINESMFQYCDFLVNIIINDGVTSIGPWAFDSCQNLKGVNIPQSVTRIGHLAFANCQNLTEIKIPAAVKTIEVNTFSACKKLFNITFAEGSRLEKIDDSAFANCTELRSIVIPYGVTVIGNNAFAYCANLINVETPSSLTTIGSKAFYCCVSLTFLNIPDSVISIGGGAFAQCLNLQYQIYNGNLMYLNNVLISATDDLIERVFFKSTTRIIYEYAFYSCSQLTAITIPESVISIERNVFTGCVGLSEITVADENPVYRSEGNCLIRKSDSMLIFGCKTSIIPNTVTGIGNSAFEDCTSLTEIIIPDSVLSIGQRAFFNSGLIEIEIPGSVINIEQSAFANCEELKNVIILSGVIGIEAVAFANCKNLESVIIPQSVTSIGLVVFLRSESLTVYVRGYSEAPEGWDARWDFNVSTVVWEYDGE